MDESRRFFVFKDFFTGDDDGDGAWACERERFFFLDFTFEIDEEAVRGRKGDVETVAAEAAGRGRKGDVEAVAAEAAGRDGDDGILTASAYDGRRGLK